MSLAERLKLLQRSADVISGMLLGKHLHVIRHPAMGSIVRSESIGSAAVMIGLARMCRLGRLANDLEVVNEVSMSTSMIQTFKVARAGWRA